jgi:LacI family transcriptional regulator
VVVCNELTTVTRASLIDGTVDLVLGTPIAALARAAVEALERAVAGTAEGRVEILLPADLHISESV